MGSILLKYIFSFLSLSLLAIILLDYIILPNYVGFNNEHYLPDVRGEYLEKASYQNININQKDTLVEAHTY